MLAEVRVSVPRRSLQVLRDTLNCTLPIEIIYNGPGEMDNWAINKFQARLLRPLEYSYRQYIIRKYSKLCSSTSQCWLSAHLHSVSPLQVSSQGSPSMITDAEPLKPCVGCRLSRC